MKTAVCPGSFDPITLGHLDVIRRAAGCFDAVFVCVSPNAEKRNQMFTPEEKLQMVRAAVADLTNVEAELWPGLLADFAREQGACALVKGVRGSADFDWELQLAQINRDLCPGLDTILLTARPEHRHVSSTMVREMLRYRQDLSHYIPPDALGVLHRIREGKV